MSHEMKEPKKVKKAMAKWVGKMPKEVRDALFRDCCTVTIEGTTEGDRNVTHWRRDVVEVVVDDGGKGPQIEWGF